MRFLNTFKLTVFVWGCITFLVDAQTPSITANLSSNGSVSYQIDGITQNTYMFTLFGDGTFSTIQNPTHIFAPSATGYTTETYLAKAYDPNLPPKITVQTGAINYNSNNAGTFLNPPINMSGDIDIFTSWATAQNYENFYILAFRNTTKNTVDGCVEFLYNHNEITVDTNGILIYNGWVTNQNAVSIQGNYSNKIEWEYKNLTPNEVRYIYIPAITNIPIGQNIHVSARYSNDCRDLGGSSPHVFKSRKYPHDPNYKIVNKECTKLGFPKQQELIYTIGFFNDGQYYAKDVFVADEINTGLDASNISLVDYEVQPTVSQSGNTLFFEFLNLNLPGTNQTVPKLYTYDQASTYFSFKICTESNLYQCIDNFASIVFDTQPVFYTNTSQICPLDDCTDYDICSGASFEKNALDTNLFEEAPEFIVAPNPTKDILNISIDFNTDKTSEFSLSLLDFSGRTIQSIHIQEHDASVFNKTISLKDIASGLYFLTIETKEKKYTKKIIKN